MSYDDEITDSGLGIMSMLDESSSDDADEFSDPSESMEPLEGSDEFGYEDDSDFDKEH